MTTQAYTGIAVRQWIAAESAGPRAPVLSTAVGIRIK